MALIRCPQCDTLHDIQGAFLADGPRKVRCASCRNVWEAVDPDRQPDRIVPANFAVKVNPAAPPPVEDLSFDEPEPAPPAKPAAREAAPPPEAMALGQDEIDAMDFSLPPEPASEDRQISPEELEALFADDPPPAPAPRPEPAPRSEPAPAPVKEPIVIPAGLAAADSAGEDPERRANRRDRRLAATEAHHKHEAEAATRRSMTGVLLAAGIGSLAMLGILRHETVRLFPQTAPLFSAIGLGVKQHTLDIDDIRSRLTRENGLETLEVTGTISNLSKAQQRIPVLRLSIRSASGQEIYVWTATAEPAELAPGEKVTFRRRLASPPADSHSVMVRFVAKDDIVAAIR